MRIRLTCLPRDVDAVLEGLRQVFDVHETSRPYANRSSKYVRVYIDFDFVDRTCTVKQVFE